MKFFLSGLWGLVLLLNVGLENVQAQDGRPNYWNILSEVNYRVEEDEYGELYVPEFSEKIKALEGKQVTLQGFIIPFEGMFKPEHLILSSLPVDACFFCGGGGPETVAEVYLKEEMEYTARPVKIKGRFKINKNNMGELMYILEDASFIAYADED